MKSDSELEDGEEIEDDTINDLNADDWDDSALIEAWDMAKNEYLKHHGLESEDTNPLKRQKTQDQTVEIKDSVSKTQSLEKPDQTIHQPTISVADNKQKSKKPDESTNDQTKDNYKVEDSDGPISSDQLNALMAWYWAGYYTAKLNR